MSLGLSVMSNLVILLPKRNGKRAVVLLNFLRTHILLFRNSNNYVVPSVCRINFNFGFASESYYSGELMKLLLKK